MEIKYKASQLFVTAFIITIPLPAMANHLFTQNTNNTPTWIQSGQGVQIDQVNMEPTSSDGSISLNFSANSDVPDGADTSNNNWWAWSAGDVLRFSVPTEDGDTSSTTISYDSSSDCVYDICGGLYQADSYFYGSLATLGSTMLLVSEDSVSESNPLSWTLEALSGQFSLAGYRINFANGRPNGASAAPLDQSSVVDSGDLDGGVTPDIDDTQSFYAVSDLQNDNVSSTFDGGTLTVDVTDEVSNDFSLTTLGGTIDTNSYNSIFSGVFSGDGELTKTGDGNLALTGINTYSGGTTVTQGTLTVGDESSLGDPKGRVTLDGGGLSTTQSMTLERELQIGQNHGWFAAAPNTELTQNGNISGSGDLTLSGLGTLVVNGAEHAHDGNIYVNAGMLRVEGSLDSRQIIVGSMGSLGGSGSIGGSVTLDGTFSPGSSPGTTSVAGDVTMSPSSTLEIEIDGRIYDAAGGAGTYDRLVLTGAEGIFTADGAVAPILRGISAPANNDFTPTLGDSFRVVTTANPDGVTGEFTDISQPVDGLEPGTRFDVLYGADYIDLFVTPLSFTNTVGARVNENVYASAVALDAMRLQGAGEPLDYVTGFYGLDQTSLARVLRQGAGEIHAFTLGHARDTLRRAGTSLSDAVSNPPSEESVWFHTSGNWSDWDAMDQASGYDDRISQFWVGRDLHAERATRTGLALGYSRGKIDTDFDAEASSDTLALAAYHQDRFGNIGLEVTGGVASSWLDVERQIELSNGGVSHESDSDVQGLFLSLGSHVEHELTGGVTGRLWSRLNTEAMHANDYQEQGSTVSAQQVQDTWNYTAELGLGYMVSGELDTGWWQFGTGTHRSLGEVSRDLALHDEEWKVEAPGDNVTTGFVSAGIGLRTGESSSLSLSGSHTFARNLSANAAELTYRYAW